MHEKEGIWQMAKSQINKVNPPIPSDRPSLTDYSQNIQGNMVVLFQAAHDHLVLSTNPVAKDIAIQTLSIVDTGIVVYLVAKTSRGLFKSPDFTFIGK
jgi:hypothetical protein